MLKIKIKSFNIYSGPQGGDQYFTQIDKNSDGTFTQQVLMGVKYVPLTDKSKQLGHH